MAYVWLCAQGRSGPLEMIDSDLIDPQKCGIHYHHPHSSTFSRLFQGSSKKSFSSRVPFHSIVLVHLFSRIFRGWNPLLHSVIITIPFFFYSLGSTLLREWGSIPRRTNLEFEVFSARTTQDRHTLCWLLKSISMKNRHDFDPSVWGVTLFFSKTYWFSFFRPCLKKLGLVGLVKKSEWFSDLIRTRWVKSVYESFLRLLLIHAVASLDRFIDD